LSKQIRVRKSGLITFAIRLGSALTGFAFVVLVTSNLAPTDFGLWQLISRVIGYVIFVINIPQFWTVRYRARGTILGKTLLVECALFSAVLSVVYVIVSIALAGAIYGSYAANLYFLLISTPQIPLYIFILALEAILWGSSPEKASYGFGIFEIAKVVVGGVSVAVLHLGLTGAILAVTGAQVVQLGVTLYLTRHEFSDKISFEIISRMLRNGWLAILNLTGTFVSNFDVLLVALLTGAISKNVIAFYAAAFAYASIITYSSWIAYGLYAGILSGIDARKSANQILELQYLFTAPMVLGEIILASPLLHIFKQNYSLAAPVLTILAVASAFNAISLTFDNIITGTDTTDTSSDASFSTYLGSKMFFVAKINLAISVVYLVAVSFVSYLFSSGGPTIFGVEREIFIGILWAGAALGMWVVAVILKLRVVRQITKLTIPARNAVSILLGSVGFGAVLELLSRQIAIHGGSVVQAMYILGMGAVALGVYTAIVLAISPELRNLTKLALSNLRG